jgi:hypothetical protein
MRFNTIPEALEDLRQGKNAKMRAILSVPLSLRQQKMSISWRPTAKV